MSATALLIFYFLLIAVPLAFLTAVGFLFSWWATLGLSIVFILWGMVPWVRDERGKK